PDHVTDLVPFLFASKYGERCRKKKLIIVGGPGFKNFFDQLSQVYRGWLIPKSYPLEVTEMRKDSLSLSGLSIKTCLPNHIPESISYRFEEKGKSIVFSGDTDFSENLTQLAYKAHLFLLECSFPNSKKVKGHLIPKEIIKMARLSNPK